MIMCQKIIAEGSDRSCTLKKIILLLKYILFHTSREVMAGELRELRKRRLVAVVVPAVAGDVRGVAVLHADRLDDVVSVLGVGVVVVMVRVEAGAMVHSLVQLIDGEAELGHGQAVGEDEGGGALLLQKHSVSKGRSRHVSDVSQSSKVRRQLVF